MTDIISPEQRSKNMSAIHSKNTKPEVYFRKLLFSNGFRYGLNSKTLTGHPDIYLRKYNTAIFVNGCFWHRHKDCKYAYSPKSRIDFWQKKFSDNAKRDLEVKKILFDKNVKCLIIWECTVKKMIRYKEKEKRVLNEVLEFIKSQDMYMEI